METKFICLSSFEYALIGSANVHTYCPSCGYKLIIRQDNTLNSLSSLILILGASVYVFYKLSNCNDNMKRISRKIWQLLGWNDNNSEPVYYTNNHIAFNEYRRHKGLPQTDDDVPDLDLPSPQYSQYNYNNNNTYDLYYNDRLSSDIFSDSHNHLSNYNQNMTIDKIDEVLKQIEDIKKSIVEIDTQLFSFSGSKCVNFNPSFLTLTNTDLDNEDYSVAETSFAVKEPKTPFQELEWDLTDVDIDMSFAFDDVKSLPVTDTEKQKLKTMNELLEDAKQMGLLNNILEAISSKVEYKCNNRDSAYFED